MAGQKSGKAPGQTPYAPGGAEVWSDSDRDYFTDPYFHREASVAQSSQQAKDVDRLDKTKGYSDPRRGPTPPLPPQPGLPPQPSYAKGGQVGKIGGFGMKRSKPDFAAGGGVSNYKKWSK